MPAARGSPADIEAIRYLIQVTARMKNAGDIDGWVALFGEGAVYLPAGEPAVTTREGLRASLDGGKTRFVQAKGRYVVGKGVMTAVRVLTEVPEHRVRPEQAR